MSRLRVRGEVLWVVVALVVALGLTAGGAATGKLSWLALAVPIVLAVGYLLGAQLPVYALAALIACITVERAEINLMRSGTIALRLDEVLGPAIAAGLMVRAARTRTLLPRLRRIPGLLPLGLFLLLNLVVTIITAATLSRGNLTRGLHLVIILFAGALCYVAVGLAMTAIRDTREITFPLMLTAGVEATIGIVALVLSLALSLRLFGVQTDFGTMLTEPYGTMYEANFFGHYTAAMTALVLALVVGLGLPRRLRWGNGIGFLVLIALTTTAMILSLTRSAWLGLGIGIVAMAAIYGAVLLARHGFAPALPTTADGRERDTPRKSPSPSRHTRVALGVTALTVMLAGFLIAGVQELAYTAPASLVSSPGSRLGTALDFSSGSGYGRMLILKQVLTDWLRSPLFGLGNGSFNIPLPKQTSHPWIYSMALAILHDSGLVGVTLIVWFLWAIGHTLWQTIRSAEDPSVRWLAIGVAGAAIVLLVGAQATSSFYLMLLWVFLGLAAALPPRLAPVVDVQRLAHQMAGLDHSPHALRDDSVGASGRT